MELNWLILGLQSAYSRGHSTETAVINIISDLLTAVDRGQITILGLLDLSAAFDTGDQTILIDRLRHYFFKSKASHCLGSSHSCPTERRQSASPTISHQLHLWHVLCRRVCSRSCAFPAVHDRRTCHCPSSLAHISTLMTYNYIIAFLLTCVSRAPQPLTSCIGELDRRMCSNRL